MNLQTLHQFLDRGDLAGLASALKAGSPPDAMDRGKRTPLMYAALEGSTAAVRLLLDAGAAVNAQDAGGLTALHFAAQGWKVEVAEVLLGNGASVELTDSYGNSALFKATLASSGRGELITMLLAKGADPHRANNSGVSPWKLAHTIGNFDIKQHYASVPPPGT
jgi:ankyrin repeat protein